MTTGADVRTDTPGTLLIIAANEVASREAI